MNPENSEATSSNQANPPVDYGHFQPNLPYLNEYQRFLPYHNIPIRPLINFYPFTMPIPTQPYYFPSPLGNHMAFARMSLGRSNFLPHFQGVQYPHFTLQGHNLVASGLGNFSQAQRMLPNGNCSFVGFPPPQTEPLDLRTTSNSETTSTSNFSVENLLRNSNNTLGDSNPLQTEHCVAPIATRDTSAISLPTEQPLTSRLINSSNAQEMLPSNDSSFVALSLRQTKPLHLRAQQCASYVSANHSSTLSLPTSSKSNPSFKAVRSSTINRCKVCKKHSNGWHYGVRTCEACKQFFLRSTKEKRVYTCINDSKKCLVNDKGRFGCRKCRFKSCLTNGMNIYLVREDRTRGGRTNWKPYHYSPSQITEILKGKL